MRSTLPHASRYIAYMETYSAAGIIRGTRESFNAVRGDGATVHGTSLIGPDGQTYVLRKMSP
jgi:hypothetical protein